MADNRGKKQKPAPLPFCPNGHEVEEPRKTSMSYKHIDGVAVVAHFAEEDGLRYRYRLEVTLQGDKEHPPSDL